MKNKTHTLPKFAYTDAREFVAAYQRQDNNNYKNDIFYFRGGSTELKQLEQRVAKIVGLDGEGYLSLTTSGMSAVITALEIASPTAQDIVVHGSTEYGQIYNYINTDLRDRKVQPIEVNSGDSIAIEKTLKKLVADHGREKIKIIFLETVGNGPDMPVLDIEKFLALKILREIDPLIILDNTLPTNSVLPLAKYIKQQDLKIIGIESATKFYLHNEDLGGLLYTYDAQLFDQLLTKRKRIGATPGWSLIKAFKQRITKSKKHFDGRNKSIMSNTQILSNACNQSTGAGKHFIVSLPGLAHHTNHSYAASHLSQGAAPVFFISTTRNSQHTAEELFYLLEEKGALESMLIAESFGFEKTSVSYSPRFDGYIRFAGGLESAEEIDTIGKTLQKILSDIYSE